MKYEHYRDPSSLYDNLTDENKVIYHTSTKEEKNRKDIMKIFLELAFMTMTENERQVYKLKNEKYYSHQEISEMLGITLRASQETLKRAN